MPSSDKTTRERAIRSTKFRIAMLMGDDCHVSFRARNKLPKTTNRRTCDGHYIAEREHARTSASIMPRIISPATTTARRLASGLAPQPTKESTMSNMRPWPLTASETCDPASAIVRFNSGLDAAPGIKHRDQGRNRQVLTSRLAGNAVRWKEGERLDHLFEQRCDELDLAGEGEHAAIVTEDCSLTYRELDNRANQVARYLLDQGVKSGDRVAILFDKSVHLYVALLAVMKINAAYLPVCAGFPKERVWF